MHDESQVKSISGKPDEMGHVIRHLSPPLIWQDGFPIGNGFLGAMIQGRDTIGTTWAIVSLIQLVDQPNRRVRLCSITDWPETLQRGPLGQAGLRSQALRLAEIRRARAQARAMRESSLEVTDNIPYKKICEVLRWNLHHECDSAPHA